MQPWSRLAAGEVLLSHGGGLPEAAIALALTLVVAVFLLPGYLRSRRKRDTTDPACGDKVGNPPDTAPGTQDPPGGRPIAPRTSST